MQKYIKQFENISIVNGLSQSCKYNANSLFTKLFYFSLSKTYDIYKHPYNIFNINTSVTNFSTYFNNLKNLNYDIICINIHLDNHQNILIYRKIINTLEHYEPNGVIFDVQILNQINYILNMFKNNLPNIIIIPSWKLHGGRHKFDDDCVGLQVHAKSSCDERGYCMLWCQLITNLVLKFPNITTESIICDYLHLNDEVINNKMLK